MNYSFRIYFLLACLPLITGLNSLKAQTVFGEDRSIIDASGQMDQLYATQVSDLDGDGFEDVIFATRKDHKVGWFKNLGDGTFSDQKVIEIYRQGYNDYSVSVNAGDIDSDGDNDVLFTWYFSYNSGQIIWYENLGGGQFSGKRFITTFFNGANSLHLADVDQDGDQDAFVKGGTQGLAWYENDGAQNFLLHTIENVAPNNYGVMYSTDVNGDGWIDLVARTTHEREVVWFENEGDGDFGSMNIITTDIGTTGKMYISDLDSDNLDDIIITDTGFYEGIRWLKNQGNGSFADPEYIADSLNVPGIMLFTDLDHDGDQDMMASQFPHRIVWLENEGSANFIEAGDIENEMCTVSNLIAADLNNDGELDLISANHGMDIIRWDENLGNGQFAPRQRLNSSINKPASISVGDINGNGHDDILLISDDDTKVSIFFGDGMGNFSEQQLIYACLYYKSTATLGDLDGDDDLDIVLGISYAGDFSIYESTLIWFENDGSGQFEYVNSLPIENHFIHTVEVEDLDMDGDLDVLSASRNVSSSVDPEITWHANDGSGNFGSGIVLTTDVRSFFSSAVPADLDNDGDPDIVIGNYMDRHTAWMENSGNGVFSPPELLSDSTVLADRRAVIDLDGDNQLDILAWGAYHYNDAAWFRNLGGGEFAGPFHLAEKAVSMTPLDADNDSDIDLVVGSSAGEFFLLENDGSGTFSSPQIIQGELASVTVCAASDLDGDGDQDVIAGLDTPMDKLVWYPNRLGEDLTVIRGRIYWDKNADTVYTSSDVPFMGLPLTIDPGPQVFYTNAEGQYVAFTADTGQHGMTISPPLTYNCYGEIEFVQVLPQPETYEIDYASNSNLFRDFIFKALRDSCRTASGQVFDDLNSNGTKDIGEGEIRGIWVNAVDYGGTCTRGNGQYEFSIRHDDETEIELPLQDGATNGYCPYGQYSYEQTFPEDNHTVPAHVGDVDSLDFGVHRDYTGYRDVGIYSLRVQQGNAAGKRFRAWLDFKRVGWITEPCTLRIEHDPLLTIQSAGLPIANSSSTFVEWIFEAGTMPSSYCLEMTWMLDSSAVEGNTLHWEATIGCPPLTDACGLNNMVVRDVDIISGPARFAEGPVRMYSMSHLGEMPEVITDSTVLSYVITFTNPLEVPAYDVIIIDTLPEEIDLSTISYPFGSYPSEFTLTEDGVFTWVMKNINLPPGSHEDGLYSSGFVQFNASLVDGLPNSSIITNRATVVFNGGVVEQTNEVLHRIGDPVSSVAEDKIAKPDLFPNPFSKSCTLRFNTRQTMPMDLELVDITGRTWSTWDAVTVQQIEIERSNLAPGIYFINIYRCDSGENVGTYKIVAQ